MEKIETEQETTEEVCEYCDGVPLSECTGYKCWER